MRKMLPPLVLFVLNQAFVFPQISGFSFAGIGLDSDFAAVAARYRHSTPQDSYISIASEDSHDHISGIAISGSGPTRRVRITFETRSSGQRPDYPACAEVQAKLARLYGPPRQIRRFSEEASRRADRVWRSRAEELVLICFEGAQRKFYAEAVQITPR